MGTVVSEFVKSVDMADPKRAKQLEAITALRNLAEAKKDLWVA